MKNKINKLNINLNAKIKINIKQNLQMIQIINLMKKLKNFFFHKLKKMIQPNDDSIEVDKILKAKILIGENIKKKIAKIEDIEFKVFSQFGDDGIIQYLINKLEIDYDCQNFIEFGVENYQESNTRFLLFNNNWSGLIIDSSKEKIEQIKNSNYFWKYNLEAKVSFIDKDNINNIIKESQIGKKIGLLSIDIDGNDYWIWKSINVIDPLIVIVEFNSVFGFVHKLSIPYKKTFSGQKLIIQIYIGELLLRP